MSTKRMKNMIKRLKRKAKNPEGIKFHLKKNATKMSNKLTWPEKQFKKILKELNVEFEMQKIVDNKIFDFYVPSVNMLIEIDGDYWHANPDTLKGDGVNRMQARNINNDKYKDILAEGLGYGIERVWENDLKNNYSLVKSKFKKLLK